MKSDKAPVSRRRFIARSATGLAVTLGGSHLSSAAESAPSAPAIAAPPPPASSTAAALTAPAGINANDLLAAEKIAAISFTAEQREPLVRIVAERAANFPALRSKPIPNHVMPAVAFNPRIAGVSIPSGSVSRIGATAPLRTVTRPATPEDLAFLSVADLAALLRSRQVTSRELTELSLARLQRYDPVLSAVVTLMPERALQKADAADAEIRAGKWRGPLHGVPWGAKDLFAVRDYPTTWGAAQFKAQRFDEDAEVVRRLDSAGAVLVAKLSLGALANGDTWFGGQTKCPWNLAVGSSGSSAGPCAAVSAGLVPFALGSETLGSIVSPCTRNAVTGLRPTFGRVSRTGAMALAWSMDKIGPIARTVEDCALIFDAIHGVDPADPTAVDAPFAWRPDANLKGRRIGVLSAQFDQRDEWFDFNQGALDVLRKLGATLVPLDLPSAPIGALRTILLVEAAAAFDDLTRSGGIDDLVAPRPSNWNTVLRAARYVPAVEYIQANRLRTLLVQEMEQRIDAAGLDAWVSFPSGNHLVVTNLTGHPTVCVPTGFRPVVGQPADSPRRLTAALSFNARLYRDDLALAVAHAFQGATDWHTRRPPIA